MANTNDFAILSALSTDAGADDELLESSSTAVENHPDAGCTPAAALLVMDEVVDRDVVGKYTGQVKWFNDKLGYGFITVCDGVDKGKDIFVHHTGVRPVNSNYKTLRKGEYVNFNLTNGHNGPQAVDVTGICGGSLMCDVLPIRRACCPSSMMNSMHATPSPPHLHVVSNTPPLMMYPDPYQPGRGMHVVYARPPPSSGACVGFGCHAHQHQNHYSQRQE